MRYRTTDNCLDIMLAKYPSSKLTKLGLPVRYRDNKYWIYQFALHLIANNKMNLADFADVNDKYLMLKKLGSMEDITLFKQYLSTFDDKADAVMQNGPHNYSVTAQDYVLKEILTDKNIDDLAWNARDESRKMLYRNGLIGFGKEFGWRRSINPSQLGYDEISYYRLHTGRLDFSAYKNHDDMRGFEGKGRMVSEYILWDGFIETVPAEFLTRRVYRDGGSVSMIEHMEKLGLSGQLLEIAKERCEAERKRVQSVRDAEKKAAAELAEKEFAHIVALFAQHGIIVDKPKNERWHKEGGDRYTVETIVDGVPHTMYIMKSSTRLRDVKYSTQVAEEARDHEEMIAKYKDIVHAEFHRLKEEVGCTHVMEGGGAQMQAFFSDADGYISIMYLGLKGEKADQAWTMHKQRGMSKDGFGPSTFYYGIGTERTKK